MKRTLIIFCLLFTAINGIAQNNLLTKDSISTFYEALISVMKTDYLYKDKLNWPQLELELKEKLVTYSDFRSSLSEAITLFDKADATHCLIYFGENVYSSTYGEPTKKDLANSGLQNMNLSQSLK